jgi:hypothetical protein
MVSDTLVGKDPLKETSLLHAIHCLIAAWHKYVSPDTIANCWQKNGLFGPCYGPEVCPPAWKDTSDLEQLAQQLHNEGRIGMLMDINQFINPVEEQVMIHRRSYLSM